MEESRPKSGQEIKAKKPRRRKVVAAWLAFRDRTETDQAKEKDPKPPFKGWRTIFELAFPREQATTLASISREKRKPKIETEYSGELIIDHSDKNRPSVSEVKNDEQSLEQFSKQPQLTETLKKSKESKEVRPQSDQLQAEHIMQKVIEAAEHNDPIERDMERRHEVKGETATTPGAVPVGAVLAQLQNDTPPPLMMAMSQDHQKSHMAAQSSVPSQDMYKLAIQKGFWAGIGVLAVLLIFWIF